MDRNKSQSKTRSRTKRLFFTVAGGALAALLALTVWLGFGWSDKPVTLDKTETAGVTTSANYSNLTGNQVVDHVNNGTFTNGNYIDYSYNGSYYSVTLPRGTYSIELYGAQGGSYSGAGNGGRGAYVKAQVVYGAPTTIYIYIGGMGANGSGYIDRSGDSITRSGGYNGGGYGTGYGGSGGGGATDIRTTGGSATSSSSYNTRVLVAAGGGGGNGTSSAGTHSGNAGVYYGANGCRSRHRSSYSNDEAGGGGGYYGGIVNHGDDPCWSYAGSDYFGSGYTKQAETYGNNPGNGKARITAVNVNKPPATRNANITLKARGITETVSIAATTIASDNEGVYFLKTQGNDTPEDRANYGIWFNSSCNDAYLASKYINWTWTSNTTINVTRSIKYPRNGIDGSTRNGEITLYTKMRDGFGSDASARGYAVISFKVTIPANRIVERTRGAANGTVITHTTENGTTRENNRLFVGRSNTTSANFTGNVPANTIYNPVNNKYTAIFEQPIRYNVPVTIKASDLVVGDNANGAIYGGDSYVVALNNTTAITGNSRKYKIDEYDAKSHTVAAYNASRVAIANAYSQISFRCLTPDPTFQVFTVTVYQVENATVYTSGVTQKVVADTAALTVDIVFKMDNTRPVLKDADDITGNNGLNANGASINVKAPVLEVNTLSSKSISLNDIYRDVDTANITTSTHQIRAVTVAEREFIQLDKYGKIVSAENTKNAASNKSYFNVVSNESASNMFVDSSNTANSSMHTGMLVGGDFETGFNSSYISTGTSEKAFINYSFSGITLNVTGLRATYDMYKQDRTGKRVAVGGTIDGSVAVSYKANITANVGHFYILINILDKNDPSDTGIWLPLGIRVANALPTETSVERGGAGASNMPYVDGNENTTAYFTPMGITVGQNTCALGYYFDGTSYVNGGLQPLASDADNFFTEKMVNGNGIGTTDIGKLNDLVTIVSTASDIQGSIKNPDGTVSYNANGEYFTVAYEDIFVPKAYFGARVPVPAGAREQSIQIDGEPVDCVVINGLKVTLKNWTHNRFLHAKVVVRDVAARNSGDYVEVEFAVRVSNSAPVYVDADNVAKLQYEVDGKKVNTSYTPNGDGGVATYTYDVPAGSTLVVTPYDFLRDANMPVTFPSKAGGKTEFTLNGLSGLFDTNSHVFSVDAVRGAGIEGGASADNRMSITGLGIAQNNGTNYSGTYRTSLVTALNGMIATRNFGDVSNTYSFASRTHDRGVTNVDRLYFARNSDSGANLDGFTFDPYGDKNVRNDFAAPGIVGDGFISCSFGSMLKLDGVDYDIDFLVISTVSRTQSEAPAEILLNVRDRMGAGASGEFAGVKAIRIKINVINSKPRVQNPNKVYTLSTNPLDSQGNPLADPTYNETNITVPLTITPSVLVINATAGLGQNTDLQNNFLIDDEDGANVSFYTASSEWSIEDENGNTTDGPGGVGGYSYLGDYLLVSITPQTITITALNSTQAVRTLYLNFMVTDGMYDKNGVAEVSRCRIRIEVVNSYMTANKGSDGFEDIYTETVVNGETIRTKTVDNLWNIQSLTQQDQKRDRYIVSGSNAEQILRGGDVPVSSGQIKKAVTDTDRLQGAVLSPSTNVSGDAGFINADFSECTTDAEYIAAAKKAVPGIARAWGSGSDPLAVAVRIGVYTGGNPNNIGGDLDGLVESYDIIYFVYEGSSTTPTRYTAAQLTGAAGDSVFADAEKRKLFFDDQGRWIVRDWAVRVRPGGATSANQYICLQISVRDETRYGGSTAGKRTGYISSSADATTVIGSRMFMYNLFVNGLGIIPYTYYNQFDGYYTVADGDGTTAEQVFYVPTYDGRDSSVYKDVPDDKAKLYLDNNKISYTGTNSIRSYTNSEQDKLDAGVHSGQVFDRNSAAYKAGYTYEVWEKIGSSGSSLSVSSEYTERPFKYSDTIVVNGNNSRTYVPMSYFALSKSLVTTDTSESNRGAVKYFTNRYVAYDLPAYTSGYTRDTGFQQAVTISDGTHIWRGTEGEYALARNPYVEVQSFDLDKYDNTTSAGYQTDLQGRNASPYFNRALSVTTYTGEGLVNDYMSNSANYGSLVGNGHLMYLKDQENSLVENRFGIYLTKKNTRSASASLTISVAVAQCKFEKSATFIDYRDDNKAINTANVTFKLEIANSPVDIVTGGNVNANDSTGYYTALSMDTNSGAQRVVLSRSGSYSGDAARIVTYSDADKVVKTPASGTTAEIVDEALSDKAKFFAPSLNKLGTWAQLYPRVKEHKEHSTELTNTATRDTTPNSAEKDRELAQVSMRNYFGGLPDENAFATKDNNFKPNGGIYGEDNGFSKYFDVGVSSDGSTLTIVPRAKTTINDAMLENVSDRAAYYVERGLVYSNNGTGYYPLKVLIYDDHGDGFAAGSYVALEIRVTISNSAPQLLDSLQPYEKRTSEDSKDKQIKVPLPVSQQYSFNIKDVLSTGDLLTDGANLFWESDYNKLKEQTLSDHNLDNMFRLETGMYLKSPFDDWNATDDDDLRVGNAGFSNSQTNLDKYGTVVQDQPDVAMYMDYYFGSHDSPTYKQPVSRQAKPDGNSIYFIINRRTTYTVTDDKGTHTVQQNEFTFKLSFKNNSTDTTKNSTANLYIIIQVNNQAPTIRDEAKAAAVSLNMHVNDSFTLITTPYDRFIGASDGSSTNISDSARYSTTNRLIEQNKIGDASLLSRGGTGVKYNMLTSSALSREVSAGGYKLHDHIETGDSVNQHLGYLALADDDTPWGLRIENNISFYESGKFYNPYRTDLLPMEGNMDGTQYPIAVTFTAAAVCTNMPITVPLVDADGAHISFTIYVTVESSRPLPIPDNHASYKRHEALLSTTDSGVFETYMITNALGSTAPTNVTIEGGLQPVKAYGEIELPVNKIAYDADKDDYERIALYYDRAQSGSSLFTLNGIAMSRVTGEGGEAYVSPHFRVEPSADRTSFTIKCLTFNADSDVDTLGFYVNDMGTDAFNKALFVQIRIHTLYTSIRNETQTSTNKIIGQVIPETGLLDNINVKSVDDYNGVSVELADDPELLASKKDIASTYQFLQYVGEHESVDQTLVPNQGIKDYDVMQNETNLRYGLKIYAFLDPVEAFSSDYKTANFNEISALFDLSARSLSQNALRLKTDTSANPAADKYLVGGYNADGSTLGNINNTLVMFINRYFLFELGDDNVSLSFRPVTSNINVKIPFYVELKKYISPMRSIKPNESTTASSCGTLFYVGVADSKPIATQSEDVLTFSGYVGESGIFKIHDKNDTIGSLYSDSDIEDVVSASYGTYDEALRLATEQGIEWDTNGRGKRRAIDIEVNNTDTPVMKKVGDRDVVDIPAHSLKVTITRRIDVVDDDGNYLSEVTVPIIITSKDKTAAGPSVTLNVVIKNSELNINPSKVTETEPDVKNGYYNLSADPTNARAFFIDAYVVPGKAMAPFNFISGGYLSDNDYTSRESDTESFRLVTDRNENSDKYLEYGSILELTSSKQAGVVAKVTPVFGDRDMPDDELHFTGFTIDVLSPNRNIDDAIAYMHVVDRGAGNPGSYDDVGFTVTLRIHILNAPPVINSGKQVTDHILVGSEEHDGTPIVIDIDDYVTDPNGDVVNIIGIAPVLNTNLNDGEIDPNLHCTLDSENDGEIVRIELSADKKSVTITPRRGFYGYQSLDIMVVDATEGEILAGGDQYNIITFRHNFTVAYDINSAGELNRIEAIRSLPQKVTPQDLFRNIPDLYGTGDKGGASGGDDAEQSGGATTSAVTARDSRTFNPGDDYIITKLEAAGVKIVLDGDDTWTFTCDKESDGIDFTVTFKYRTERDNESASEFTKHFTATVGPNSAPVLLDHFRYQNGEAYLFQTQSTDYGLDNNGTVVLTPAMLFNDIDLARGDSLTFDKNSTSVVSSTLCSVRISDDGTLLYLTFNMRGETDLTVGIKDRTGEVGTWTFKIKNIDRPEPSFWNKIVISFETGPIYWWCGIGGFILLILFLILLIILLKRRKRKREELEAILISEMELEEQMMRLSGGAGAAQQYQSYGYLPPTMPVQNDPTMMLGSSAPQTPPDSAAIGLNPGQASDRPAQGQSGGNNGVPTDSDM